jgi:hypothetical protein
MAKRALCVGITVLQRLSPSDVGPAPVAGQAGSRAGRREADPDGAEQIA